jgi:hypothetical protein
MDPPPDKLTIRISRAASVALETPIEELPPLSEAINPDALESLIVPTPTDSASNVTVTFSYAGLHVFVQTDNTVYVRDIREIDEPPSRPFPTDRRRDYLLSG